MNFPKVYIEYSFTVDFYFANFDICVTVHDIYRTIILPVVLYGCETCRRYCGRKGS